MPTTTYTDSTFGVTAIGGRTNSAGTGVADWTAEESRLLAQILGEGALTSNAFIPAQQTVADMTVKVGSGTSKADVYVISGDVTGQGNYVVRLDVASVNVTIGAADASQARTDEIYLVVQDTTYDASARGLPRLGYRKGDLGGANPGVDSTWKASALIARITVPAGATTITTARISDQRTTGGLRLPQGANLNVGGSSSTAYMAIGAFATTSDAFTIRLPADTVSRLNIKGDGALGWSAGSGGSLDTTLSRNAAGELRTNGDLQVVGGTSVPRGIVARYYNNTTDLPVAGTTAGTSQTSAETCTTLSFSAVQNRIYRVEAPSILARMNVANSGTGVQFTYTTDGSTPTGASSRICATQVHCQNAGTPYGCGFGGTYTHRVASGTVKICLSMWNMSGGTATTLHGTSFFPIEVVVTDEGVDPNP